MTYRTVEVELENGQVRPSGSDTLPPRARGLLTLLDHNMIAPARACSELAERWAGLDRLPPDEANSLADDIEQSRASLPVLKPSWD